MQTTKKIKILDFKLSKNIWNLLFWLYKSKFYWTWMDFHEHKEYVFWEPVKNIDWKASTKTEKIYSKIFEEEKQIEVLFLIDTNSSMFFSSQNRSKKDILEEVFYSLAFSVYKNSDSFWVIFYGSENEKKLDYKKDFSNILNTISFLENLEKTDKIDKNRTKKILEKLVKEKTKNKLIFILSDDIFENDEKNLKILWLKNEIIFINIFDYFENNLEKISNDFSFSSWKNFLNISLNSDKIEEFNNFRKEKIKKFWEILKKNKIWYIYLDTKKDIFKEIAVYFSKI